MTTEAIHLGKRLAPDEVVVWQGRPSWRRLARNVFHLDWIGFYLALLLALNGYQAWAEAIPMGDAVRRSVPLVIIFGLLLAFFGGLAWLTGRTTRYTITSRRVILEYGLALSATLSLPYARIQTVSVSVNPDHTGDIPLRLEAGSHMPFLKLWPHARGFRLARPEPSLRCVPQAAVVAGLLTRAILHARRIGEGCSRYDTGAIAGTARAETLLEPSHVH